MSLFNSNFFYNWVVNFLYIFRYMCLFRYMICKYLCPFFMLSSYFLVLWCIKVFNFDEFVDFFFCGLSFLGHILEDLARSGKFIPAFSPKGFIVNLSHAGILILIDLIFMDSVRSGSNFILCMWLSSCPASFVERVIFPLCNCLCTLGKINWL